MLIPLCWRSCPDLHMSLPCSQCQGGPKVSLIGIFVAEPFVVLFAGWFCCSCVKPADLPVSTRTSAASFPPGLGLQPVLECDPLQPAEAGPGAVVAEEDFSSVAGKGGHCGIRGWGQDQRSGCCPGVSQAPSAPHNRWEQRWWICCLVLLNEETQLILEHTGRALQPLSSGRAAVRNSPDRF